VLKSGSPQLSTGEGIIGGAQTQLTQKWKNGKKKEKKEKKLTIGGAEGGGRVVGGTASSTKKKRDHTPN